jgi:hypothetical protein
MPIQQITTNDQFSDWFNVTNELVTTVNALDAGIGDRTTLNTNASVIVSAINEIAGQGIEQIENPTLAGSQYVKIPSGPTNARPSDPKQGMLRYNEDTDKYEAFYSADDYGQLTAIAVNAATSGSTSFPTAVLTGGTAETNATYVVHARVYSIAVNAIGSGYTANDVITLSLGTGTEATATVDTVDTSGEILTLTLTTPGDYTQLTSGVTGISVTGGTGTGATVDVELSVLSVEITDGGEGYNSAPTVALDGTGLTQTASATIGTTGTWSPVGGADNIENLNIDSNGFLTFNADAEGNVIRINANSDAGNSSSVGGAINVVNTNNVGSAMTIYSNAGSEVDGHLVNLRTNNNAFDRSAMFIDYRGTTSALNIVNRNTGGGNANVAFNCTSFNPDISAMWIRGNEVDSGTIKITHTGQGSGGVATDAVASGLSIAMNMSDDTLLGTSGQSGVTKSAAKGFFIDYGLSTGKPFQIVGYTDKDGTPVKRELYNLDNQGRLTLPLQPFSRGYGSDTTSGSGASGSGSLILWNFIDNNGDTQFTHSNGQIFLPTDGWYDISVSVISNGTASTDFCDVRLLRNTTDSTGGFIGTGRGSGGGTNACASFTTTAFFAGGQYLAVEYYGGSSMYTSSSATNPFVNISIKLMA